MNHIRRRIRVVFVLMVVLHVSCSATREAGLRDVPDSIETRVTVRRQPDGPLLLRYEFSEPVRAVSLASSSVDYRSATWQVLTDGIVLRRDRTTDRLVGASGQAFTEVAVRASVYTDALPKDYEPFVPFSDGSVALYTGALEVEDVTSVGTTRNISQTQIVLAPAPGEHVLVHGIQHDSIAVLERDAHATYVYFGSLGTSESGHAVAVIDPALPPALAEALRHGLPALLDRFSQGTGRQLRTRPVVLATFQPDEHTTGFTGGALPGLIQLGFKGNGWGTSDGPPLSFALRFLAHETAHLWNNSMYSNASAGDAWLHEGGAEAFALEVLADLGYVGAEALVDEYNRALAACVAGLEGAALNRSAEVGRVRNHYDCGLMLALATTQATRLGILEFWRSLFDEADSEDGRYTQELYLKVVHRLSGNEQLIHRIEDFTRRKQPEPGASLRAILLEAGVPVKVADGKLRIEGVDRLP